MTLSEELNTVLEEMEKGVTVTVGVAYSMLLRCYLELNRQDHEIRVLKDKLNYARSE